MSEFTDVITLIVCSDIAAEHDFLVNVLGFESGGLERAPDGNVVHGEVSAGDRRIWLHVVSDQFQLATPATLGMANGGTVVHVTDVDAHFARVKAKGADITAEPTDQEYGQREYGVRDPDGHNWWFATPTAPPAGR